MTGWRYAVRAGSYAGDGQGDRPHILQRVCVNHEALIFRHGRIFPESFVHEFWSEDWRKFERYGRFLVKNYALRRPAGRIPAGMWVIDNLSAGNYHHWLVDSLARLVRGERLFPEADTLLLPEAYRSSAYVEFTLLAFPRFRVRWIAPSERLEIGELQCVGYTPPASFGAAPQYDAELVRAVAERIGKLVSPAGEGRRLYFTREGAGRRRARNERDIVRLLEGFGFQTVTADTAGPAEQVRLCRGADVVVGVHGAALTNMMFMPRGGRVVELQGIVAGDTYSPENYRVLAATVGLEHRLLRCALDRPVEGWQGNHSDIVVDLDELRTNLIAIL